MGNGGQFWLCVENPGKSGSLYMDKVMRKLRSQRCAYCLPSHSGANNIPLTSLSITLRKELVEAILPTHRPKSSNYSD